MRRLTLLICVLVLSGAGTALVAKAKRAAVKTQLLSAHETEAVFAGIEYRRCRGLTGRCPERCGSSGEYARFTIAKYLKYAKPGKYGDAKAKDRLIHISDFHKKPTGDPKLNAIIKGLKKGDRVLLSWNHNYVTRDGSSAPQRPITKLEKIAKGKPVGGNPAKPAADGKLSLNGTWEVRLTDEQKPQKGDAASMPLFVAQHMTFAGDLMKTQSTVRGAAAYNATFRAILDTSQTPVRLLLASEWPTMRLGLSSKFELRAWPCLVDQVDGDNIRIAFKRSAVVRKDLGTQGGKGGGRPGPRRRPGPGRGTGFSRPVTAAYVKKKLAGKTLDYPEKITTFGDLKGDLVVIPLRRVKESVPTKANVPPKGNIPPIKKIAKVLPQRSVFKRGALKEPAVIKSAEDAAKYFDGKNLAAIEKQVDFKQQFVLIFAWRGSGGDRLNHAVLESYPEQIVFKLKRGRTRDLRPHVHIYALRNNVTWKR